MESKLEKKERRKQIIENNGVKLDELGLTYPVKDGDDEKIIFQNAIKNKMDKLTEYKKQGFKKIVSMKYK